MAMMSLLVCRCERRHHESGVCNETACSYIVCRNRHHAGLRQATNQNVLRAKRLCGLERGFTPASSPLPERTLGWRQAAFGLGKKRKNFTVL